MYYLHYISLHTRRIKRDHVGWMRAAVNGLQRSCNSDVKENNTTVWVTWSNCIALATTNLALMHSLQHLKTVCISSSWWRTPSRALPYWRLDAKYPCPLPSSKPCGPQRSGAERPHLSLSQVDLGRCIMWYEMRYLTKSNQVAFNIRKWQTHSHTIKI